MERKEIHLERVRLAKTKLLYLGRKYDGTEEGSSENPQDFITQKILNHKLLVLGALGVGLVFPTTRKWIKRSTPSLLIHLFS